MRSFLAFLRSPRAWLNGQIDARIDAAIAAREAAQPERWKADLNRRVLRPGEIIYLQGASFPTDGALPFLDCPAERDPTRRAHRRRLAELERAGLAQRRAAP